MEEVDAFYDFWFDFKSWRIIQGEDEHILEDAEDAYEKRWMHVENERERKRLKKEHMKNISMLRDLAFKRDPRVLAAKAEEARKREEEKQKKAEEKAAREAARRAEEDMGKSQKQIAKEEELRAQAAAANEKAAEAKRRLSRNN